MHEISIDMTLARHDPTDTLKPYFTQLEGQAVFGDMYNEIPDSEKAVKLFQDNSVSICVLDQRIYDKMATISENILPAYRLMKVLNQNILPSSISPKPDSTTQYSTTSIVSSHVLKQILYHCVEAHPHQPDWTVENLHIRMADMFGAIQLGNTQNLVQINTLSQEASKFNQEMNKHILLKSLGEHRNNLSELVNNLLGPGHGKKSVNQEISNEKVLAGKHEKTQDKSGMHIISDFPARVKLLVLSKNLMHPCNIEITKLIQMAYPIGTALTYKVSPPGMLYTTHPLIQWCKSHIRGLYMKTPGPDLSTITADDFCDSWPLYQAGILTAQQLQTSVLYQQEIAIFSLACEVFSKFEPELPANLVRPSLYFGIDQQAILDAFLALKSVDHFSPSYWQTVPVIPESLPLLSPRERAFILRWCQLARSLKDGVFGCDTIRYSDLLYSPLLERITFSLECTYIIIQRFLEHFITNDYLHAHVLPYHVITHMMLSDMNYFSCVGKEDYAWAEAVTEYIIQQESMLHDESYCLRSNTDFETFQSLIPPASDKEWRVLRMQRGPLAFYRCVATCGDSIRALRCPRSSSGTLLNIFTESDESLMAMRIKLEVLQLFHRESEMLESRNLAKPYRSMEERMAAMTEGHGYPGNLEIAAVAYLARTQIHLYEGTGGKYTPVQSIPDGIFTHRPPIYLRQQPGTMVAGSHTAHYDLFIRDNQKMDLYAWYPVLEENDIEETVFQEFVSAATEDDKQLSFSQMLDCCKFTSDTDN